MKKGLPKKPRGLCVSAAAAAAVVVILAATAAAAAKAVPAAAEEDDDQNEDPKTVVVAIVAEHGSSLSPRSVVSLCASRGSDGSALRCRTALCPDHAIL